MPIFPPSQEILQSPQSAVTDDIASLTCLERPLLRCGKAYKEFKALILSCTMHSVGSKHSMRDWAKLRYMGSDISGFKNVLAGYKSTINIALGDVNLYALSPILVGAQANGSGKVANLK